MSWQIKHLWRRTGSGTPLAAPPPAPESAPGRKSPSPEPRLRRASEVADLLLNPALSHGARVIRYAACRAVETAALDRAARASYWGDVSWEPEECPLPPLDAAEAYALRDWDAMDEDEPPFPSPAMAPLLRSPEERAAAGANPGQPDPVPGSGPAAGMCVPFKR
jgi:hypothetical protein